MARCPLLCPLSTATPHPRLPAWCGTPPPSARTSCCCAPPSELGSDTSTPENGRSDTRPDLAKSVRACVR
eukprot:7529710-Alexandrium_andersonii.AAC.1